MLKQEAAYSTGDKQQRDLFLLLLLLLSMCIIIKSSKQILNYP